MVLLAQAALSARAVAIAVDPAAAFAGEVFPDVHAPLLVDLSWSPDVPALRLRADLVEIAHALASKRAHLLAPAIRVAGRRVDRQLVRGATTRAVVRMVTTAASTLA